MFLKAYYLEQGLNFVLLLFCKGPDSKYFRFGEPYHV